MNTDQAIIWSAGFFDGEGSIYVPTSHRGQYGYLRLSVGQKIRPPLDRLYNALGVGKIYGPYVSTGNQYAWHCHGREALFALETMLPYLIGKAEQANVALTITKQNWPEIREALKTLKRS